MCILFLWLLGFYGYWLLSSSSLSLLFFLCCTLDKNCSKIWSMKKHILHEVWTEPWNSLGIIKDQRLLSILEVTHACAGIYKSVCGTWNSWLILVKLYTFNEMAVTDIIWNPSHHFVKLFAVIKLEWRHFSESDWCTWHFVSSLDMTSTGEQSFRCVSLASRAPLNYTMSKEENILDWSYNKDKQE